MRIISWLSVESEKGTVAGHDFQKAGQTTTWHTGIVLGIWWIKKDLKAFIKFIYSTPLIPQIKSICSLYLLKIKAIFGYDLNSQQK